MLGVMWPPGLYLVAAAVAVSGVAGISTQVQRLQSSPFDNFRLECTRMAGATGLDIRMVGSAGLKRHDIVVGLTCEPIEELFPWYGIPMGIADMEREDCHYSNQFDPIIDEAQEYTCNPREYLAGITRLSDTRVQMMCCRLRTRDEDNCVEQYYSKPLGSDASTEIKSDGFVINAIAVEELSFRVRFCTLTPRAIGLIYHDIATTTTTRRTTTATTTTPATTTTETTRPTTTSTTTTPGPTSSRRVVIYKRPHVGRLITLEPPLPPPPSYREHLQSFENIPPQTRYHEAEPITPPPPPPPSQPPPPPTTTARATSTPIEIIQSEPGKIQKQPPQRPSQERRPNLVLDAYMQQHEKRRLEEENKHSTTTTTTTASKLPETTTQSQKVLLPATPKPLQSVDEETAKSPFEGISNDTKVPSLARQLGGAPRPKPPEHPRPPPPPMRTGQEVGDYGNDDYDIPDEIEPKGPLDRRAEIRRKPAVRQPSQKQEDKQPPLTILDQKMFIGFPDQKPDLHRYPPYFIFPTFEDDRNDVDYLEMENPVQIAKQMKPMNNDKAVKTFAPDAALAMPALIVYDSAGKLSRQRDPESPPSSSPTPPHKLPEPPSPPGPPGIKPPFVEVEALIPMQSLEDITKTEAPLPNTPRPTRPSTTTNSQGTTPPSRTITAERSRSTAATSVVWRQDGIVNRIGGEPQYEMPEYEPYDPATFYHTPSPQIPPPQEMVLSFCTKEIALRDSSNLIIACGSDVEVWIPPRCPTGSQCFIANDSIYRICCAVSYGR